MHGSERFLEPRVYTLVYAVVGDRVLLIRKKRGFGEGLINAPGGKVRDNERIVDAAHREFVEEVCAEPGPLEWRGVLEFYNNGRLDMVVHVFVTDRIRGEPCESDEAAPQWFSLESLPYSSMWADDRYWLPLVLGGARIYGRFWFRDWQSIEHYDVYKLENP